MSNMTPEREDEKIRAEFARMLSPIPDSHLGGSVRTSSITVNVGEEKKAEIRRLREALRPRIPQR